MVNTLAYYSTVLSRNFTAYAAHALEQIGLSQGLLYLLLYVGRHPGCAQAELTNALDLDWGYCQRSTLRLVEDGFFLRKKQGRAYHLTLSEKGMRAFETSHQVFFDWDNNALQSLSEEERTQLLALLAKVQEIVSDATKMP